MRTEVKNYVHLLAGNDLAALRAVLGSPVGRLFTRGVDIYPDFVSARAFALRLSSERDCVVESDWADTPDDAIDYHQMEVSVVEWPNGVGRVSDDGRELGESSTIHLPNSPGPITLIQVLEKREASDRDAVHYDHAIIFTRADGFRFSLSAVESIIGGLEFSLVPERIDEFLAELRERIRLS